MTDIVYEKDGLTGSSHQLENDFYIDGATYYVKVNATDSAGSNASTVVPWRYVLKTVQYKLEVTASVSGNPMYTADPASLDSTGCATGNSPYRE